MAGGIHSAGLRALYPALDWSVNRLEGKWGVLFSMESANVPVVQHGLGYSLLPAEV